MEDNCLRIKSAEPLTPFMRVPIEEDVKNKLLKLQPSLGDIGDEGMVLESSTASNYFENLHGLSHQNILKPVALLASKTGSLSLLCYETYTMPLSEILCESLLVEVHDDKWDVSDFLRDTLYQIANTIARLHKHNYYHGLLDSSNTCIFQVGGLNIVKLSGMKGLTHTNDMEPMIAHDWSSFATLIRGIFSANGKIPVRAITNYTNQLINHNTREFVLVNPFWMSYNGKTSLIRHLKIHGDSRAGKRLDDLWKKDKRLDLLASRDVKENPDIKPYTHSMEDTLRLLYNKYKNPEFYGIYQVDNFESFLKEIERSDEDFMFRLIETRFVDLTQRDNTNYEQWYTGAQEIVRESRLTRQPNSLLHES